MMRILLSITIVLFLSSDYLYGQRVREFSEDRKQLIEEYRDFFSNVNDEASLRHFNAFMKKLEAGAFTEQEEEKIVSLSNLMLDRRLRAHPHFAEYFRTLNLIFDQDYVSEYFHDWHEFSHEILPESRDDFNDFNKSLALMIEDYTIYESRSIHWQVDAESFEMEFREGEPVFLFGEINLSGKRGERGDTIKVHNTTGTFYPLKTEWDGSGGIVNWERSGLPADKVYAELGDYNFDISRPEFQADSVTFYNRQLFERSLTGKLTDRAEGTFRGERSSYPEFVSYDNDLSIDDISEDVHYRGGFTQRGLRIIGSGAGDEKAEITFYFDGREIIRSKSNSFLINPENIRSEETSTTVFLDQDSIYHPRHNFNFNRANERLNLSIRDDGISQSPFFNSYHQMEMYFEGIAWTVGSPQLEVEVIGETARTYTFKSNNFYREQDYVNVQSIMDYNPVDLIRNLSRNNNDRTRFYRNELANFMGVSDEYAEPLIRRLAERGFLYYEPDNQVFYIHEKVFNYFKANRGVRDHDVLRFDSDAMMEETTKISLLNFDLNITGADRIEMSDSNNVVIYPKDGNITLKKNRDMEFDGHIMAGRFDFYGTDFTFNYDNFSTDLNSVDSVKFVFPEVDPKTGRTYMRGIENVIQDVEGTLYFDHPHNKSGRRDFPEFPIFDCPKEAFVYYDYPHIQGGVYDRDAFYFHMDPFKIDSLNDFTREGLTFEGSFHSGGIFPEFDYELTIQDDYSLGFERETPADGYAMFGGKGTGTMEMKLSNSGFFGEGKIEFLGSVTYSDEFSLYPDSVNSMSNKFEIPDDPALDYPVTEGLHVYTHWRPHKDTMFVDQREEPFKLYEQEAEFSGQLALNPQNLAGDGNYLYRNAKISSDVFAFDRTRFDADTAHLEIASDDPDVFAFKSPNVHIDFDMDGEIAKSRANDDTTTFDFPLNKYITSIRAFEWDLDAELIDFHTPEQQADEDAWFLSLASGQDSLWFNSTEAQYDLSNYILQPKEIPHIASADAHIFPDDKTITIERDAHIPSLENARIKMDTTEYHHELYNALVNLFGRKDFAGYADYDYEDKNGEIQTIHFSEIKVDRISQRAEAIAEIEKEADPFHLSPHFRFYGEPKMFSQDEYIRFDGYVLPDHQQEGFRTQWFRYNEHMNPDSLYFNVKAPEDEDERTIFSGIFLESGARPQVYMMFMGHRRHFDDQFVFDPDSILYFDEANNTYSFGNYSSIFEDSEEGNIFALNPYERNLDASGEFELYPGTEHFDITTVGHGQFRSSDSLYTFDVTTIIDFPFDEDLLTLMADSINDIGFRLPEIQANNRAVRTTVMNKANNNPELRDELLNEVEMFENIPKRGPFDKTMTFAETEYVWNADNNSFQTTRAPGLANILDITVNKRFRESGIKIQRRRGNQDFNMYLQISGGSWYFLSFDNNGVRALVSDAHFEEQYRETREDVEKDGYRLRSGSRRQVDVIRRDLNLR